MIPLDLSKSTILITGSAGLLGSHCTSKLAEAGARLVLFDVNSERLEVQARELRCKYPGRTILTYSRVDLLNSSEVDAALLEIEAHVGVVNTLICAAYPRTDDWHLDFLETPLASWQENVDKHLNGYIHLAQRVARRMIGGCCGHIIFLGSIYGIVGPDFSLYEGLPQMTMPGAYAAIKGGLSQMTRYLACYLGPHGIRVNSLSPGGIKDAQPAPFIERYESKVPLRRLGAVEDVSGPLLFLCSELSGYITGHNLVVDGGWTAL